MSELTGVNLIAAALPQTMYTVTYQKWMRIGITASITSCFINNYIMFSSSLKIGLDSILY